MTNYTKQVILQEGCLKAWMDEWKSTGLQKGSLSEHIQGRTLESSERGTEDTEMLSQENYCLLERDIQLLVCQ